MKNFKTFTVYCNADEAVVIADVLSEYQQQIKDLETANAILLERNYELQVDNEESLKEVEEYSKRSDDLRKQNLLYSEQIKTLYKINGEIAHESLNTSPKSKFIITVEEF